jgi:hypothetical protein
MLSMIENGKNDETHPAFWAPFVLVGEGGYANSIYPTNTPHRAARVQAR